VKTLGGASLPHIMRLHRPFTRPAGCRNGRAGGRLHAPFRRDPDSRFRRACGGSTGADHRHSISLGAVPQPDGRAVSLTRAG
jgi:hypothetical protein